MLTKVLCFKHIFFKIENYWHSYMQCFCYRYTVSIAIYSIMSNSKYGRRTPSQNIYEWHSIISFVYMWFELYSKWTFSHTLSSGWVLGIQYSDMRSVLIFILLFLYITHIRTIIISLTFIFVKRIATKAFFGSSWRTDINKLRILNPFWQKTYVFFIHLKVP